MISEQGQKSFAYYYWTFAALYVCAAPPLAIPKLIMNAAVGAAIHPTTRRLAIKAASRVARMFHARSQPKQ